MKRALLPLIGSVLVLGILFSGTLYRESYVAPWDAAGSGGSAASLRSALENLLVPAASRVLRLGANADDVEGTGQLVEGVEGYSQGNIGAEYQFPERLYPYRAMLSEDQQAVYNQAYANIAEVNRNSFVLVRSVSEAELIDVMSAILNDQPQFFYLETKYSYGYLIDGSVVSLKLTFNSTADSLDASRAAFTTAAEALLQGARELPTAIEREQYLHDALLERCAYNQNSVNNQSAYSALVTGSSVCAGYARAFQYLMLELGLPCYYCEGTVDGGNHAWNIVELAGGYYNLDPSWNDVSSDSVGHTYFNLTDAEIGGDHARRGLSINLPACDVTRYGRDALYGTAANQTGGKSKTYQSLGFGDGDVIRSLSAYYSHCRSALISAGAGTTNLTMVVENIDLVNQIYAATKNKDYIGGYAEAVAEELELRNCSVSIQLSAEYLADNYVLLNQTVTLSGEQAVATPIIIVTTPTPSPVLTAAPTPEPPVVTATAEPAATEPPAATDAQTEGEGVFATAEPGDPGRHRPSHAPSAETAAPEDTGTDAGANIF